MTLSVLPERLRDKQAWIKTDQHVWYKWFWFQLKLKYFTFGPRAKEWWARFREYPITLIGLFGEGYSRWESSSGDKQDKGDVGLMLVANEEKMGMYLSRIQPWSRYAIFINWPLFFHFHVFYKQRDVLKYPETKTNHLNIGKYFEVAFGFKRDGDLVYWLTAYIGGRTE